MAVYCHNCGNQVSDEAVFCPFCASRLQQTQDAQKNRPVLDKRTIAVAAGALAGLVLLVVVIVSLTSRVYIGKYIADKISPEGCDGYAQVSAQDIVDYDAIISELGRAKYNSIGDEMLDDAIDVSIDKSTQLSNGDQINVEISVDYKYVNSYDFSKKLSGKKTYKRTYTIENLLPAEQMDPFDAIDVVIYDKTQSNYILQFKTDYKRQYGEYTVRVSDEGDLELTDSSGSVLSAVYLEGSASGYSSTGKLTVTADFDEEQLQKIGIVIKEKETKIVPAECNYLGDGNSVSKNDFEALKEKALKTAREHYTDAVYEATYFNFDPAGKGGETLFSSGYYNRVQFLFSYVAYGEKKYVSACFNNVKLLSTGKIYNMDDLECRIGSSYSRAQAFEGDEAKAWTVFYRFTGK